MQDKDSTIPPIPPEAITDNTQKTPAPPVSKPAAPAASPASKTNATGKGRSVAGILFNLGLLAGLVTAGFYTWEQYKAIELLFGQYNQLVQQRSDLQTRLDTLEASRQQLNQTVQDQVQASQAGLAAQAAQVEALNRELINTRLRINDSGAGASQAWMLSEAESLLRFAGQRLLLEHDVRAAIGLYVAGDDLLKQINDPAIFSVREALALDLGALQAVREVDVPGVYARLGALASGLDTLQVQPAGERPAFRVNEAPAPATDSTTTGWWESARAGLAQYFVITREASEAIPQLSAEQTWVLRETLRLKLEQARVALVHGQPELYQAALAEAASGIDTLLQGAGKDALLAELETLRAARIVTVVPAVNLGLTALRQLQSGSLSLPEGRP